MSDFEIKLSNANHISSTEQEISQKLNRIESQLENVISGLNTDSSAMRSIKSSLKKLETTMMSNRQKVQLLSSTFEQVAALYEKTENDIISNGSSLEKGIKSQLEKVEKELQESKTILGMDESSQYSNDPVNLSNGNYVYEKKFVEWNTPFPLTFRVFYNAQSDERHALGCGWMHTYEMYLLRDSEKVEIVCDDGVRHYFSDIDGHFYPLSGTFGELTRSQEGYTFVSREQIKYVFSNAGKLVREEDFSGDAVSLSYDEQNQLCRADDSFGNYLLFSYEDGGLKSVADNLSRTIEFSYEKEQLHSFADAEKRITKFEYDAKGRITQIITPKGIVGLKNVYDSAGRIEKQVFPDGGEECFSYDEANRRTILVEQNGNRIVYEHDERQRNTRTVYGNGEETVSYNEKNQRTSFTDRLGHTSRFSYDKNGNLSRFVNAKGDTLEIAYTDFNQVAGVTLNGVQMHQAVYNEKHLQKEVVNALGYSDSYEYDEKGNPICWTQADGTRIRMTYDKSGNVTSISNSMGGITYYEYDAAGRVVRTVDANGNETRYAYNQNDELVEVVNAEGSRRSYAYDASGNVVRQVEYNGGVTEMEYNSINKIGKITDAEGSITRFTYDKMWNLSKKVDPDGGETIYEYDPYRNLTCVTDANGQSNHMEHDACGNVVKRTAPDGGIYRISYDELNRPVRVIDPCGVERSAVYDERGNVLCENYPDGSCEQHTYDLLDRVTSYTNQNGYTLFYQYNEIGKVTEISDADTWLERYEYYHGGLLKKESYLDGRFREYRYDGNENLVHVRDQDGGEMRFDYDCMNRVVKFWKNDEAAEEYRYDKAGNITAVRDGEGNWKKYTYSLTGKLTSVTDEQGNETHYQYDACHRLVQILQPEDGKLNVEALHSLNRAQQGIRFTSYRRDAVGNIVSIMNPEGQEEKYTYDGCNRLASYEGTDGAVTRFFYNPDDTEKACELPDGRKILYEYNELKQLIRVEDWLGITRIRPDSCGRPQLVENANGETVRYQWLDSGELSRMVYPDGMQTDYRYDGQRRLQSVQNGAEGIVYDYYDTGKLKSKVYPNACRSVYRYNRGGHLAELTHLRQNELLAHLVYGYDKNGRKESIKVKDRDTVYKLEYTYDPTGKLELVKKDGTVKERYRYDLFGNRTYAETDGNPARFLYNRLDQLTEFRDQEGLHRFSYDLQGNLCREELDGTTIRNLSFDCMGLLSEVQTPEQKIQYRYDGFGNRVGRDVYKACGDATRQNFVYDISRRDHNLLTLRQGNDWRNVFWDGTMAGIHSNEGNLFWLEDDMQNPMYCVQGKAIAKRNRTDVYGGVPAAVADDGYAYGFTGYWYDHASGYSYASRRNYDNRLGRFLERDPHPGFISLPLTLNAYMYCMGDPVNYADPTGAVIAWLAGGIIGAVSNVAVKFAGDVVTSVKEGKVHMSSWQSYTGTAAGGFVSGTVIATTGNVTLAGAAGNATETLVTDGLSVLTGAEGYRKEDGYSWKTTAWNTIKNAATGAATGFAFGAATKYIKIPGINKGRGSFEAVWKQVMTKASKGQIANVAWKTIAKGLVAYGPVRCLDQVIKKGISAFKDYAVEKGKSLLTSLADNAASKLKSLFSNASSGAGCPMT